MRALIQLAVGREQGQEEITDAAVGLKIRDRLHGEMRGIRGAHDLVLDQVPN